MDEAAQRHERGNRKEQRDEERVRRRIRRVSR
jgi:hypothetical protein